MRAVLQVALLTFCTSIGIAQDVGRPFQTQDLGNGYRVQHVAVDLKDCEKCFEGTAYYFDLYDRSKRLGRVGKYSISPDGNYVVWEDHSGESRDGRLLMYVRMNNEIRDVTQRPFAVPRDFKWSREKSEVVITFYPNANVKNPKPAVIALITESTK